MTLKPSKWAGLFKQVHELHEKENQKDGTNEIKQNPSCNLTNCKSEHNNEKNEREMKSRGMKQKSKKSLNKKQQVNLSVVHEEEDEHFTSVTNNETAPQNTDPNNSSRDGRGKTWKFEGGVAREIKLYSDQQSTSTGMSQHPIGTF